MSFEKAKLPSLYRTESVPDEYNCRAGMPQTGRDEKVCHLDTLSLWPVIISLVSAVSR
jgi:hypothetical protein